MNFPDVYETHALRLRLPQLEDASIIFNRYSQDSEVVRYLSWRAHTSVLQTRQFLKHCLSAHTQEASRAWVIEDKQDHELFGMIDLRWEETSASFGYVIAKRYWGQGITTQALCAVRDLALMQSQVYRFWGVCDVENSASARVMEKAGLALEGRLKRYVVHPNVDSAPRDCFCYAKTV